MRKVLNNNQANHNIAEANYLIKTYEEVKQITAEGGVAYETKSAIWAYNPQRELVTLFVKRPTEMTNDILDYDVHSKHYELHKKRILRLTNAEPATYRMVEDFRNTLEKWK